MSVQKCQSWLRKRKASVFPEYLVREYVQYHKWVRRTWRALSWERLRSSPSIAHFIASLYGGIVHLRPATRTEALAADDFYKPRTNHEIWLHHQNRPITARDAMLFRFDFGRKAWRHEKHGWLEINTDTDGILREIARQQLAPVRHHFRLPAVLCDLITSFLLEAVPEEPADDEDDED
jgi:hypothetical protein